jgi:hypothetical protein
MMAVSVALWTICRHSAAVIVSGLNASLAPLTRNCPLNDPGSSMATATAWAVASGLAA